jgi:hypothetical protein
MSTSTNTIIPRRFSERLNPRRARVPVWCTRARASRSFSRSRLRARASHGTVHYLRDSDSHSILPCTHSRVLLCSVYDRLAISATFTFTFTFPLRRGLEAGRVNRYACHCGCKWGWRGWAWQWQWQWQSLVAISFFPISRALWCIVTGFTSRLRLSAVFLD